MDLFSEIASSRVQFSSTMLSETEIVISRAAWIAYRSSVHVKTFLRENVRPSFLTRSYFFPNALFPPLFTSQEFLRQGQGCRDGKKYGKTHSVWIGGKGDSSAKDTRGSGNRLIDAISTARSPLPLDSFPIPVGETR